MKGFLLLDFILTGKESILLIVLTYIGKILDLSFFSLIYSPIRTSFLIYVVPIQQKWNSLKFVFSLIE